MGGKPKQINQLIFLFYMIFKMADRLSEERETAVYLES